MAIQSVRVNDVKFPSTSAAARRYHIPQNIITEAVSKKGLSAEEAINKYLERKASSTMMFEGAPFRSMRALSKHVGIPGSTIKGRMKRDNLTAEQAIHAIRATAPSSYEADGKSYPSVAALAMEHSVSPVSLSKLINKCGLDPEAAISEIKANITKTVVTVFGVKYTSKSAAARAYGICIGTVYSRLRRGMDLESALKAPINNEKYHHITIQGVYGVVYKIVNQVNGKVYIGCTDDLEKRRKAHFEDQLKTTERPLYTDIRKYGLNAFIMEVVESYNSRKAMLDGEVEWIEKLNCKTPNGYNLTKGGESGNMRTAVTIHGQYFQSARIACRYHSQSYESTQMHKRDKKLTWKEAIESKLDSRILINGVHFRSEHAVCKEFNIAKETIHKGLKQGKTYEEIINQSGRPRQVNLNGTLHRSIAAACKAAGVNESNVRGRIRDKGGTPEEAIKYFIEKISKPTGYLVFGTHYETQKEIYTTYGLSANTYFKRLKEGMSIEEAVSAPNRIESVMIDGITYPSIANACRILNIDEREVYRQKHLHGLSSQDAIEAVRSVIVRASNEIEFRDATYPTKTALAEAYDMSLRSLNAALSKGMSLEDALLRKRRVAAVKVEGHIYPNKSTAYVVV
ncbi:GIY-YIG nuclease family protein [Photobacterium sp. TLY01]|uniref:GIY-YIG nuclease family protein n=1 Tax=Photobacterium sp. TLY01 TaxID=2907534 RepID=UPI001F2938B0|nr:GIY-YIG nuclease family protein [Photobacterium sp. TLY01]UIP27782.1 GIY-YIG nuclease family protein [Photobacterium sp. TLY01]